MAGQPFGVGQVATVEQESRFAIDTQAFGEPSNAVKDIPGHSGPQFGRDVTEASPGEQPERAQRESDAGSTRTRRCRVRRPAQPRTWSLQILGGGPIHHNAWVSLGLCVGQLRHPIRILFAGQCRSEDDGERSVAAAFQLSYGGLPDDQRRMFGLLALHPGRDIAVRSTAALAGVGLAIHLGLDAYR